MPLSLPWHCFTGQTGALNLWTPFRPFSFPLQMESFALGPQRSQQMGHTAAGCVTANIGGNNAGNVKTVTIASAAVACPDAVSATNWIGPAIVFTSRNVGSFPKIYPAFSECSC